MTQEEQIKKLDAMAKPRSEEAIKKAEERSMVAYVTLNKFDGLIQLWNNKPKWSEELQQWLAWEDHKHNKNEVAIEVNRNKLLCSSITFETSPKKIKL